jgi:hypothetical protein
MAKLFSKEAEEEADREIARLRRMSFPDAVLEVIKTTQKDLKGFPEQHEELAKMLVVNLTQAVLSHPTTPNMMGHMIMVLSFIAIYGRAPEKHELVGFDIASVRAYFTKKYPEDVLGEE